MNRIRNFWHWATHLGVTPDLPPVARKHVVLANQIALVSVFIYLLFALGNLGDEHPARASVFVVQLTAAASVLGGLFLNARSYHRLAVSWFLFVALVALGSFVVLFGLAAEAHAFFAILGALPFLIFHRRHRLLAMGFSMAALIELLLLLLFVSEEPLMGAPFPLHVLRMEMRLPDVLGLFLVLGALGYFSARNTAQAEDEVEEQRRRADDLLLSILPREIAARLKEDASAIAEKFDDVTVLFADIAGFTSLSDKLDPAELVAFLNVVFSELDRLTDKHRLEKIKTIGDAYMVASGLPDERPDHAAAMAEFALDMVDAVKQIPTPHGEPLQMRVGIHTGPAVAGVIGTRKFSYDLWGDTVNSASRMESHGEVGRIQVTGATRERLAERYRLVPRGTIEVKGKGPMETFWLEGRLD